MDGSLLGTALDITSMVAEAHNIVRGIARRVHARTGYSPRADEIQALLADAGGDLWMLAAKGGASADILRQYRNQAIRKLTPRGEARGPADALEHLDGDAALDRDGAIVADDADGDRGRRRPRPQELADDADPLALLLLAEDEAEAGDSVQAAATLIASKRPRGRPTHGENLERAGQMKLPGLPAGGSTTRAAGPPQAPPPARALGPPPEQPALF